MVSLPPAERTTDQWVVTKAGCRAALPGGLDSAESAPAGFHGAHETLVEFFAQQVKPFRRWKQQGLHKRNAEHRLGKFELEVTIEPRRCSAFQIDATNWANSECVARVSKTCCIADLQSAARGKLCGQRVGNPRYSRLKIGATAVVSSYAPFASISR